MQFFYFVAEEKKRRQKKKKAFYDWATTGITIIYVERGRRSGIFFLGIISASDLYQLKEPFLRAF